MPDAHQGVVRDDLPENICGSSAPLIGSTVLCLEGGIKFPTDDQALVRAQDPEVGIHLSIKTGQLQVMHRDIHIYQVEDEPLYLDLEMNQVAWHHLNDKKNIWLQTQGEQGYHPTGCFCEVAEVDPISPL